MSVSLGLVRPIITLLLAGTAIVTNGSISQLVASPAAQAFIQSNLQQGLQILNDRRLSAEQRQTQFRAFLLTFTDLRRIALYTLGPARRSATAAEQDAFVDAFRNYAFAVYAAEFFKYDGQTLRVTGSIPRASGDELVRTVLVDPHPAAGRDQIEVDFRVYGSEGHYSVVDIIVAGLDLAITEQDDFSTFLAQHGNKVHALTTNLLTRAAQVRATGKL